MAQATAAVRGRDRYGATSRRDAWWRPQLLTILVLGGFIIYSTWAAFQGEDYRYQNYLSPFYSPELLGHEGWFGNFPDWWPAALASPALLILAGPLSFRTTCYYYRKAYYRAFFSDPPACAVGEFNRGYKGEKRAFIFQNLHRFAFYVAVFFIGVLSYDAFEAFRFPDGPGFGIGTLVLVVNVGLLALYTFSCHSCRHLVGGGMDCFSRARMGGLRYRVWQAVSRFNEHHMLYAWMSLIWVGLSDAYIRLLANGVIPTDPRIGG